MASTSSSFKTTYDVFLSFRGADTRDNFTSHLHQKLVDKSIQTFIDDRLERGEKIESSLMKVIEESHISVIVFSKGYASSPWCLDELVKILECRETMGRTVSPIFYHVDPSDVELLTGDFGDGFRKLEAEHRSSMDKWRNALMEATTLSGWDWKSHRPDSKLIEEVVKELARKSLLTSYTMSNDLIGIDSQTKKILSLLHIGSAKTNIRVIGLWGLGGIGKTTIAEALFTVISNQFDGHCFLSNVREQLLKHELVHVKKVLLSKLLGDENLSIEMSHALPTSVINRLQQKKVIVTLDDVNDSAQLDLLAGNWLGPGSRVIITSRDKQVLNYKCDEIYEVKGLKHSDALQLLCSKAFRQQYPLEDYTELAKRAVNYAKGVPLALEVLGSHLCKRPLEEWEIILAKLKQSPTIDSKIQNILKISYEELKEEVKGIFLDIACFFQGWNRDRVEDILISNYGSEISKWGIMRLKDKCLLTIGDDYAWGDGEVLRMHDLIHDLGSEIAEQNGSRLRNFKIICRMMTNNKVQAKKVIQGMYLDMSELGKFHLHRNAFTQMVNLRLLNFRRTLLSGQENKGPVFMLKSGEIKTLPNTLSLLHWQEYPGTFLPSKFSMENVVELNLSRSNITRLWDGDKCPQNLKRLDLCCCRELMKLPDLSSATKLRKIYLSWCKSLVEIHSSIKFLLHLTSLRVDGCKNLKMLPEIPRGIKRLDLNYSGVEELSSSILFLDDLIFLDMRNCINITNLPMKIVLNFRMRSRYIKLSGCMNLRKLPEITGNVEELHLSETLIEKLPPSIGGLSSLGVLKMEKCVNLVILPENICELRDLRELDLGGCSKLEKLPLNLKGLSSLRKLSLDETAIVELPSDIVFLSSLEELSLNSCKRLQCLPKLPQRLIQLRVINCKSLKTAVSTLFIPRINDWNGEYYSVFNYWNCVNLEENTRSKIMQEAEFTNIEYAIAAAKGNTGFRSPKLILAIPGSEIPEWYSYQSLGCSVAIQFPPSCFNTKFLGFAFCVVVDRFSKWDKLTCQCHLKYSFSQKRFFFRSETNFGFSESVIAKSDHLLLWSNWSQMSSLSHWLIDHRFIVNEASFQFECESEVKKCGIGLIYDKDDPDALVPSSSYCKFPCSLIWLLN